MPLLREGNRLTLLKEKRGLYSLQRGTTKHPQKHKHNPRQKARAFIVSIGVFANKIGRFRCKSNSLNAICALPIRQCRCKYTELSFNYSTVMRKLSENNCITSVL